MTKPLTAAQLRALEPRYTIAGLFESGRLGPADETSLEEIRDVRLAFHRWINPSRGWMTPRYGDTKPPVPRILGETDVWNRYTNWRRRQSRRVVAPSPSIPWGMTMADLTVMLVTEPLNFNDLATMTGMSVIGLVELFVKAVKDYSAPPARSDGERKRRMWEGATEDGAYRSARILTAKQQRARKLLRERVRRHRIARKGQ